MSKPSFFARNVFKQNHRTKNILRQTLLKSWTSSSEYPRFPIRRRPETSILHLSRRLNSAKILTRELYHSTFIVLSLTQPYDRRFLSAPQPTSFNETHTQPHSHFHSNLDTSTVYSKLHFPLSLGYSIWKIKGWRRNSLGKEVWKGEEPFCNLGRCIWNGLDVGYVIVSIDMKC